MPTGLFSLDRTLPRDPAIDAWFAAAGLRSPALAAIAHHWYRLIRQAGDEAAELLHDNCPTACYGLYPFASVGIYTAHVTLAFFHGATLPDPARILLGTGRHMRHVKLHPGAPTPTQALTALIQTAYTTLKHQVETHRTKH